MPSTGGKGREASKRSCVLAGRRKGAVSGRGMLCKYARRCGMQKGTIHTETGTHGDGWTVGLEWRDIDWRSRRRTNGPEGG